MDAAISVLGRGGGNAPIIATATSAAQAAFCNLGRGDFIICCFFF